MFFAIKEISSGSNDKENKSRGQFHQHFFAAFTCADPKSAIKYSQAVGIFLHFWDLCV